MTENTIVSLLNLQSAVKKGGVGSDHPQITQRMEISKWIANRTLAGHKEKGPEQMVALRPYFIGCGSLKPLTSA